MLNKVKQYIESLNLLNIGELYIVALSGGADSVSLLLLMKELGYNIHAAHCNFHLRGEESNRDEEFCKNLCKTHNIPFHFTHFDTREYAELHKISIEMAARNLRYSYFEQLRQAISANGILVAHHKNDNVETLLLNLVRGTGINGLEAIKPKNNHIIRPLLCVTRDEIVKYLDDIHQNYVTDSTNMIDDVARNKIRLNVIPVLKEINPAAIENISRTIDNISGITKILDDAIAKNIDDSCKWHKNRLEINISKLSKQVSPEVTLYNVLKKINFTPAQTRNIYENLNAQAGKLWYSSSHTLLLDRGSLIAESTIELQKHENINASLPEEGRYRINEDSFIDIKQSIITDDFKPSKDSLCITIDADKITFPLQLRNIKKGDAFIPYGMKGKKLISDYLTDRKKNRFQRNCQLVLADSNDNIIWLVGERIAQEFACTSNTINVMTMRYVINEK